MVTTLMGNSHTAYLAQSRFSALDGLRAISILGVIWQHTAPSWVNSDWMHLGTHGLALFFAISGFLITTLLLREQDQNGQINLKYFYIKRALRIFPLYYLVLILYIAVVFFLEKDAAARAAFFWNLPFFATFTSNLFVPLTDGRVIFYFAWSLAVEEQFYLLWPPVLLMLGASHRMKGTFCLALLLIAQACATGQFWVFNSMSITIAAGAGLALGLHHPKSHAVLSRVLGQQWSALAIALLMGFCMAMWPTASIVVRLLCVALVGACVIKPGYNNRCAVVYFLNLKWLTHIGSISYGMYLLHMLCKNVATKGLGVFNMPTNGLAVFCLTVALSIGLAHVSFVYFESFFLAIKKKRLLK
jgi:peptidoglycan/LPS O-acetylase OafA/YrhL